MKIIILFLVIAFSGNAMAEKSEAQQAWSDGAECAYDYMAIAITAKGEVWANKEIVGVSGVRSAIELAKKSRNIVCIIVLADAGVDKKSELVEKVLEAVHEKHGKKVYFISESEH